MPDLSLDLRFLRYALVVAEQGSFRRAALKLGVPQSTVSRRVQMLEAQISLPIFERDYTGVKITAAGRLFLEEAEIGAQHLGNAVHAAGLMRRGDLGKLRVGLFASLSEGFLRTMFKVHHERHSRVEIELELGTASAQLTGILGGRLDLAFMTGKPSIPGGCTLPLWSERVLVALPEGHALASHDQVGWNALRTQQFIVASTGPGPEISDYLITHLSELGFHPDVQVRSVDREMLINMVSLGFGVTLTTESTLGTKYPGVIFRPVGDPVETVLSSAIWLKGNSNPALRQLLRLARVLSANHRPFH